MQEGRGETVAPKRSHWALVAVAGVAFILDQLTKWLVVRYVGAGDSVEVAGDLLQIRPVRNPGGAFGILPGATVLFFIASIAIVIFVSYWWIRHRQEPFALGLVMGGGLGNVADRILQPPAPFRGHVVDFIDLPFWPTFNFADTWIVLGVGLLLIAGVRESRDASRVQS